MVIKTEKLLDPIVSDKPLVSVIMPSFNQGDFIGRAIDSILSQDYRPLEIIVVDGASSDSTVEVLHQYDGQSEVRWLSEADSGPVEAVNKGLGLANGEILSIQSSDDGYLPGAIASAVRAMKAGNSPGLVYGDVKKVDESNQTLLESSQIKHGSLLDFVAKKMWIPQQSAFFRSDALRVVGGWDERVPYTPDVDLWMRIWDQFEVNKVEEVWGIQRMHDAQRDKQSPKIVRDWNKMISQLKFIQRGGLSMRLAARAGCHRNAIRYSGGNDWKMTYHLLMSTVFDPTSCADIMRYWRVATPGYIPSMRLLSFIKQRVFGLRGRCC